MSELSVVLYIIFVPSLRQKNKKLKKTGKNGRRDFFLHRRGRVGVVQKKSSEKKTGKN
jgi:hypothetical protein